MIKSEKENRRATSKRRLKRYSNEGSRTRTIGKLKPIHPYQIKANRTISKSIQGKKDTGGCT